ncbi:MAG: archease [Thermoplasmatota archaeon]
MGELFVPDPKGISYEDHTADLWLVLKGSSMGDCIEKALNGLYGVIGSSFMLGSAEEGILEIKGRDAVEMMVDVLSEALYLMDAETTLIKDPEIKIEVKEDEVELHMSFIKAGFSIPEGKGGMEVKAVSYHGAYLESEGDHWKGRVLLDI